MTVLVVVDSIEFVFDFQDQRIDVPASINTLSVYPLWRAIREAQSTRIGLAYPVIAKASGLDTLDATQGIATFITVTLFDNWEVNSLLGGGKFILTGGNLIRQDNADPFRDNPLVTYFAFFSQSGTVTTVNTGSGVTPNDVTNIADTLLGRNIAGGSNGGRTVRDALRSNRNRVSISGSTITVYKEDDVTPAWTGSIQTANRNPITSVDPE